MTYRNQFQKKLENGRQLTKNFFRHFFIKSLQAKMIITNQICPVFWKHTERRSTQKMRQDKRVFLPALKMALGRPYGSAG